MPGIQLGDTSVVGGFRTYFGHPHEVATVHIKFVGKVRAVPFLEQCHVQTDVSRVQTVVVVEG